MTDIFYEAMALAIGRSTMEKIIVQSRPGLWMWADSTGKKHPHSSREGCARDIAKVQSDLTHTAACVMLMTHGIAIDIPQSELENVRLE